MEFLRTKHVSYFKRSLKSFLPPRYASLDSNRMTLCFFALSGLDILNELNVLTNSDQQDIIKWIYSLQIHPNDLGTNLHLCGFKGSTLSGSNETIHDCSHIAMTYTALLSLIILGDDLVGVDGRAISSALKHLQMQDGSFCATYNGSENDMRFVYCAACICYILNDWSNINISAAANYILNSLTYEGAFAQGPGLEAHGGSTFCAIASLKLMNCWHLLSPSQVARLTHWCISRQVDGFNGRPGKPADTCYSFWLGASLKLLNAFDMTNFSSNEDFLLSAQDSVVGGFAKWVDHTPDTLHTYFGICGLALIDSQLYDASSLSSPAEYNHRQSSSHELATSSLSTERLSDIISTNYLNMAKRSNTCDQLTRSYVCNCDGASNHIDGRHIAFNDLSINESLINCTGYKVNEVSACEKYALNPIHPALNVSMRAFQHLHKVRRKS